jgi:hypothetical protein
MRARWERKKDSLLVSPFLYSSVESAIFCHFLQINIGTILLMVSGKASEIVPGAAGDE